MTVSAPPLVPTVIACRNEREYIVPVVLEPVETIARSANGKIRAVISNSNEVRGASR
jgi:hypothetical protein